VANQQDLSISVFHCAANCISKPSWTAADLTLTSGRDQHPDINKAGGLLDPRGSLDKGRALTAPSLPAGHTANPLGELDHSAGREFAGHDDRRRSIDEPYGILFEMVGDSCFRVRYW
jgi:hypothetical protein